MWTWQAMRDHGWIGFPKQNIDPNALEGVDEQDKPWLKELVNKHVVRILFLRLL